MSSRSFTGGATRDRRHHVAGISPTEQSLASGYQPTVTTRFTAGQLEHHVHRAGHAGRSPPADGARPSSVFLGLRARVHARAADSGADHGDQHRLDPGSRAILRTAIRPYGPNGQRRWVGAVEADGDAVTVDGRLALVSAARAGRRRAGVSQRRGPLRPLCHASRRRPAPASTDSTGLGSIGLRFTMALAPGRERFDRTRHADGAPAGPTLRRLRWLRSIDFAEEGRPVRPAWQQAGERVDDPRARRALSRTPSTPRWPIWSLRASGGMVRSGPFAHNAMWYRDAAYVLTALQKGGIDGPVRPALPRLAARSDAVRRVPRRARVRRPAALPRAPRVGRPGRVRYLVAETYRLTRDRVAGRSRYTRRVALAHATSRSRRASRPGRPRTSARRSTA